MTDTLRIRLTILCNTIGRVALAHQFPVQKIFQLFLYLGTGQDSQERNDAIYYILNSQRQTDAWNKFCYI